MNSSAKPLAGVKVVERSRVRVEEGERRKVPESAAAPREACTARFLARTAEIDRERRFTDKIIDSLPVGLYVIDREYRIQIWNRKREIQDAQGRFDPANAKALLGNGIGEVSRPSEVARPTSGASA